MKRKLILALLSLSVVVALPSLADAGKGGGGGGAVVAVVSAALAARMLVAAVSAALAARMLVAVVCVGMATDTEDIDTEDMDTAGMDMEDIRTTTTDIMDMMSAGPQCRMGLPFTSAIEARTKRTARW
jgi:hypothetical protein